MKAVPLFSGIVLKELPPSQMVTSSGIKVEKQDAWQKLIKCKVIKVGRGILTTAGYRVTPTVESGDVVLLETSSSRPMPIENGEYRVCEENQILIVLHDKEGNSIEDRHLENKDVCKDDKK